MRSLPWHKKIRCNNSFALNKKVLLRERKRHTTRRVGSPWGGGGTHLCRRGTYLSQEVSTFALLGVPTLAGGTYLSWGGVPTLAGVLFPGVDRQTNWNYYLPLSWNWSPQTIDKKLSLPNMEPPPPLKRHTKKYHWKRYFSSYHVCGL